MRGRGQVAYLHSGDQLHTPARHKRRPYLLTLDQQLHAVDRLMPGVVPRLDLYDFGLFAFVQDHVTDLELLWGS